MLRIKKLLDAMSIASSSASASSIALQSRSIAMMPASADPFGHEGQADLYKKYRPSYSDEQLRDVEKHLLSDMSSREWAVDLGCGTGQVTIPLSRMMKFKRVIGVDRSNSQLKQAKSPELHIDWVENDILKYLDELPAGQVDLLTVAQTLHWIPIEEFLGRAHRVLKPKSGVLAVMGYGCPIIEGNQKAKDAFHRYYHDVLGSHLPLSDERNMWDCDRKILDTAHQSQTFTPPFSSLERIWYMQESKHLSNDLGSFINYLKTWSSYNQLKTREKNNKSFQDPLEQLYKELQQAIKETQTGFKVIVPYWSVICRV